MISARSGESDITDILVEGEHIDLDIQENVRIYIYMYKCELCTYMYKLSCTLYMYMCNNVHICIYMYVQCDSQRDWKVRFFTFWSISRPYCMQFTPNKNQHVLLSLQIKWYIPISREQVTFM